MPVPICSVQCAHAHIPYISNTAVLCLIVLINHSHERIRWKVPTGDYNECLNAAHSFVTEYKLAGALCKQT